MLIKWLDWATQALFCWKINREVGVWGWSVTYSAQCWFPHSSQHICSWLLNLLRSSGVCEHFHSNSWPRVVLNCVMIFLQFRQVPVLRWRNLSAPQLRLMDQFACFLFFISGQIVLLIYLTVRSYVCFPPHHLSHPASLSTSHPPPASPRPCTCL